MEHLNPETLPLVEIYTDGSCEPNPGVGGWAFILRHPSTGSSKENSGSESSTTNNRMELTAVIQALETLKKPCRVNIYSDSTYFVNGLSKWITGWINSGKMNRNLNCSMPNVDLWWRIVDLDKTHVIRPFWIRGHTGNEMNDRCDLLAREAIKQSKLNP